MQEILKKPLQWPNTGVTRQRYSCELNAKAQQVIAEYWGSTQTDLEQDIKICVFTEKIMILK